MIILLVEDNDTVRKMLRTVLAEEGHTVLDAGSAEAAVSLAESSTEPIDLLITDVVLPRLSGYDLVQWTRALHPEARVIYISGYLASELVELTRSDPRAIFLQKPFAPAELLVAIEHMLPRRHGGTSG